MPLFVELQYMQIDWLGKVLYSVILRVYRYMLESGLILDFFEKVEVANFEIASDAFSTFKVC